MKREELLKKFSEPIKVLDHGFVRLVDVMGDDAAIVQAARVSYGEGTKTARDDTALIRYLIRMRHTSPLEMAIIKLHCKMPIFVARQWVRHRTACLAGDTPLQFDLPGGIRRRGNQLYTLTVRQIWDRFQPSQNSRPDKQRNPYHKRDRVQNMHLRCVNEKTGAVRHTRIVDVWQSGIKKVYRVELESGSWVKMSADHMCLTEDGWMPLRDIVNLDGNLSVSFSANSSIIGVGPGNGLNNRLANLKWGTPAENASHRIRDGATTALTSRAQEIVSVQLIGEEMTYDIEVDGPWHNFSANGMIVHNSLNEVSGRYSVLPDEMYAPRHWRFQSQDNKQGSSGTVDDHQLNKILGEDLEDCRLAAKETYKLRLRMGIAKELSRIDLPLSQYTSWYWSIDVHNLLHFLKLRLDEHAQYEIRVYAEAIAKILRVWMPAVWSGFVEYQLRAHTVSYTGRKMIAELLKGFGVDYLTERGKEHGIKKRELEALVKAFTVVNDPEPP